MAQNMKCDNRMNSGLEAGFGDPALLISTFPRGGAVAGKNQILAGMSGGKLRKKGSAFVCQDNVAGFAAL